MKRTVQPIGFLCLLLGLCLCSPVWAQDGADDIPNKVIKLTDHVFRLTFDFGLRPNLVISEGSDGLLAFHDLAAPAQHLHYQAQGWRWNF
jgi:hypothetical protein